MNKNNIKNVWFEYKPVWTMEKTTLVKLTEKVGVWVPNFTVKKVDTKYGIKISVVINAQWEDKKQGILKDMDLSFVDLTKGKGEDNKLKKLSGDEAINYITDLTTNNK